AGPGAKIARIRIDGVERKDFELDGNDVAIAADLAFARPEPVVWQQREGDAQLVTIAAPPLHGQTARRVLFVIDGSRSMQLVGALAMTAASVDVHAIALEPGRMRAPDDDGLRALVDRVGGSYTAISVAELDHMLDRLDDWLHPAWVELALTGATAIPDQLG